MDLTVGHNVRVAVEMATAVMSLTNALRDHGIQRGKEEGGHHIEHSADGGWNRIKL